MQYKENMSRSVAGHLPNTGPKTLLNRTFQGADGEVLAFGMPVAQSADFDNSVRAVTTGDTEIFGISVREMSTLDGEFKVKDTARILTIGDITVVAAAAVAAGDPVHVIVADGTFSNAGGVVIPDARWESSTTAAGELADVRLK